MVMRMGDMDEKDAGDVEEKGSVIATSEEYREMNKVYFDLSNPFEYYIFMIK